MEDGDSRHLNLRLLTSNLSPPPLDSWLQFDEANQEFFGLPLEGDTGKAEYILVRKRCLPFMFIEGNGFPVRVYGMNVSMWVKLHVASSEYG